jgi:predicted secreted hydrolase
MSEGRRNSALRCRHETAVDRAALLALVLAAVAGCERDEPAPDAAIASGPSGIRYLSASGDGDDGFARALAPQPFSFPSDHASHPEYRTEWWYFTGNVFDASEHHYGFELTLFRVALAPPGAARESALAASTIWMGHLAVTDTEAERFQGAERLSRGAAGLAGASDGSGGEPVVVTVEDWSVTIDGDSAALRASDQGFGIDLDLTGLERIVAQGDRGLDAKGPEPGNASFYYSAPRLAVTGRLHSADAAAVAVSGSAWMDREWSTSALSPDLAGWEWFALQLDDGRDLMFYRLRGVDGSTSAFSGGSLTDVAGNTVRLGASDLELEPTREWTSPETGVRYPVAWRLTLPGENLELAIEPRLEQQELDLSVRYWEGAVSASGQANGRRVGGVGYLELAGY